MPRVWDAWEEEERGRKEAVLGEESAFDEFGYWMGSATQVRRRGNSHCSESGTSVMVCLRKETL